VTAAGQDRLENVVHVTFDNVVADELLFQLDQVGIYASAASSCASGATEPSHVLVGMGLEPARLRGALRFSLGPETTLAEIDETIAQTARIVHSLATS
jgi:cysteine desulfurase